MFLCGKRININYFNFNLNSQYKTVISKAVIKSSISRNTKTAEINRLKIFCMSMRRQESYQHTAVCLFCTFRPFEKHFQYIPFVREIQVLFPNG